MVDSGSHVTLISNEGAAKRNLTVIPNPKQYLPPGGGNTLLSPGYVKVSRLNVGRTTLKDLHIRVADVHDVCAPADGILGRDLFPPLGIGIYGVPTNYPASTEEEQKFDYSEYDYDSEWLDQHRAEPALRQMLLDAVADNLRRNANLPFDSKCTHPSAIVHLNTGDAAPTFVPQYRLSDKMSLQVTAQVGKWADNNVIVKAPVNSQWNSPLLAALNRAAKAKGKDPRICIDPRKLNLLLADDPRPIPDVSEIHQRLQGFKFITELDLAKGFNQILIAEADRIKTTFTWQGQKWMFKGAPFGLKPLSQLFQSIVEQILESVREFATPFIDNIYVHTDGTMEEHIKQVNEVIQLLTDSCLRLNLDKCHFGYTAVNVLGHLLSGDSKKPDPQKISALHSWPNPKTGNDVERFLGFTNYLRQHVPTYAHIAAPLEKLRKVKVIGALWTQECEASFNFFKKVLSAAPVLNTPLPGVPFCLATDASQRGVGWCLYQLHPDTNEPRYILFGAKALLDAQLNYSATRRELLAIVVALMACRHYLYGYKFQLFTDHMALTYLFTQKHVNYMMLNWIDTLLDFDFTVVHRPGISMVLPDALSRMYMEFNHETRGGYGDRVRSINSELARHPDKELLQFINQRFDKKFVSAEARKTLMDQIHTGGHFGAEALFAKLWHQGYYWPGMRQDCFRHVSSCLECLRFNVGKTGFHPRQFITAQLPFEHISIDTITGFKTTPRGNNVIVVITDLCTRFKLILPQQSKSAVDTASNLWKVLCTFPVPKIMQSDNGTEFINQVIKELLSLHGVDHRHIAAYNPRANGTAENAVGSTQRVLRKLLNGHMDDWDLFLPAVQLALNSHPNKSTKTSSASLLYGMNVNSFANYDKANSKLLTTTQLMGRAKVIQDLIRPAVQGLFKNAQQKRTNKANSSIRQTKPIKMGTLVMLKDNTKTSKHEPLWLGPYRIVQQRKGGTYVLQNPDNSLHHRQPPRDQLKVIDGSADINMDEIFYVERILDHKGPPSKRSYLVKWLNYPVTDNTWEPATNLVGSEAFLTEYWNVKNSSATR